MRTFEVAIAFTQFQDLWRSVPSSAPEWAVPGTGGETAGIRKTVNVY